MTFWLVLATCAVAADPTLTQPQGGRNLVLNGDDATQIVPWQVYGGGCGGTIVSPTIIMTAAHCVGAFQLGTDVYAGFLDLRNLRLAQKRRVVELMKYTGRRKFLHNIRIDLNANDIMLVRISPSWNFNAHVRKARLPSRNDVTNAQAFELTGWGTTKGYGIQKYTSPQSHLPYVLQKATVTLTHCLQKVEDQFCAGGQDDGWRDSCSGDSGGPLVVKGTDIVVGIVSHSGRKRGTDLCYSVRGTGYTNVYYHLESIRKAIKDAGDEPRSTRRPTPPTPANPSTRKPFTPSTLSTQRPRPQPPTHSPKGQPGGADSCTDSQPASACKGWAAQGQCDADIRMRTSWCACTCARTQTRSAGTPQSLASTTVIVSIAVVLCIVLVIAVILLLARVRQPSPRVEPVPALTWVSKLSPRQKLRAKKELGAKSPRKE
eukprot:GEMP01023075.1.p1 GENE.GEMP01023075.1~~GEMP01023075.1.p1  ORF type:complete len:431 (+),score=58.36 GEMP01023075.1:112-1404(+)